MLPVLPLMRIGLVDPEKNLPVAVVREYLVNSLNADSLEFREEVRVDLRPYRERTLGISLTPLPLQFSLVSDRMTRVDVKEMESAIGKENQVKEVITDKNISTIPTRFALYQNFPNPFNPATTIAFDLPEDSFVELVIYDITGRRIRTLVRDQKPAGTQFVEWDVTDDQGVPISSGVYVYSIQAGNFVQSKKMLFVK